MCALRPACSVAFASCTTATTTAFRERAIRAGNGGDLLVPIHVRKDGLDFRLFCTFMTLGTPQDVTLQELRIETFFPADNASEDAWKTLAHR